MAYQTRREPADRPRPAADHRQLLAGDGRARLVRSDDACVIVAEPARGLTGPGKLAVLRAAVAAAPQMTGLRGDLVDTLLTMERFDEALETLRHWPEAADSYRAQMLLATCRLVPHDAAGDTAALAAAARAADLAPPGPARAAALTLRAKAERRQGATAIARATLAAALEEDPANVDACKRFAAMMIAAGEIDGVLAFTDDLLARGIAHPQVLNARAVALARSGQLDEARATVAFTRFMHRAMLATPPGYADLASFNASVAAELMAHPARRVDPHGSASRSTLRVDAPTSGHAPLATLLMAEITRAVAGYVAALPDDQHPWRRARPPRGMVHGTCAITGPTGFETWHIHQQGWLSGVYYIAVPDSVAKGADRAGCIAFGLDNAFAGSEASAAFGEIVIRPRPGMLMLFPSHVYHRTYPHGTDDHRICMAFDIWPR